VKSSTECCAWASTENWECADGKESDNEDGSRDGDGASDDEEVALLQRCWLRLLSLAYHALSVGSLLQLFRRRFSSPSSESTQSTDVLWFQGRLSIVWRSSFRFTFIHSFNHSVVCLTTGPNPLPKRALHIVRSRASSFQWEYPLLSLRSSSSFLHLLPRLPVPSIFPSITCCRRQFLRKMWPI
jgi:hypothetical protein